MSTAGREPSFLRRLVEDAAGPAWLHDAAGTLLHASAAWRAAAPPGARTLPQAWLALLPPYDLLRHLDAFGAALRAGAPYAFEHRLAGRPDDAWYRTQAVPVRAGGEPVWLGTTGARAQPDPAGAPAAPARIAGLRLETLADPGAALGGVWCDAFVLCDGRLGLSAGRLIPDRLPSGEAPALVRTAIRAAALVEAAPDRVLAAADAALTGAAPGRAATALVAFYDPPTGLLDYAGAGHPPALLHDGAETVTLDAVPRPPLGRPARSGAEVRTARLRPGSVLLLQAGGPLGSGAVILLLRRDLDGPGQA